MNTSKTLLLLAALQQFDATPPDWRQGLLQGMSWLCDQLIAATAGHSEHDYEHKRIKLIQSYVESAFKHPQHQISDQAVEQCRRILGGVPDEPDHE